MRPDRYEAPPAWALQQQPDGQTSASLGGLDQALGHERGIAGESR